MNDRSLPVEHIAWQVSDPPALADWYRKHCGFQVVRHAGGPGNAYFLRDGAGRVTIEVYSSPDISVPDYRTAHPLTLHLALDAGGNPGAARDRLIAAGATLVNDFPKRASGDRLAMLRDPWGFPLQLVSRRVALDATPVLCIGQEALDLAHRHPRLVPVAYHTPYPPEADADDSELPCPAYSSLGEAIERANAGLAILSVPNTRKNTISCEEMLIRAGMPFAILKLRMDDWSVAERLAALADSCGTPVFCHDHYHLSPTFQAAKTRMESLGQVLAVRHRFALPPREGGFAPWVRSYRHLVLEDLGYHHFALLRFLCGSEFHDGWCASRSTPAADGVRNHFNMLAEMKGGWTYAYDGRWGCRGPAFTSWPGEVHIEGETGVMTVSKESLLIDGVMLAPDEMEPKPDWIAHVVDQASGIPAKTACLTRLQDFLPVSRMIDAYLKKL